MSATETLERMAYERSTDTGNRIHIRASELTDDTLECLQKGGWYWDKVRDCLLPNGTALARMHAHAPGWQRKFAEPGGQNP